MDSEDRSNATAENRISCSCKSTCSTKRSRASNRGCPCKAEGIHCNDQCSCGSTAKPCKNKPSGTGGTSSSTSAVRPAQRANQPYSAATNRPSEQEERAREKNNVKEFIQSLDEPMAKKLCIRSLRRGVGSMDYIHSLLIAEDDLDEDDESLGTAEMSQAAIEQMSSEAPACTPEPQPGPSASTPIPWCKCKVCQLMPQQIENKCCGLRRCVSTHTRFQKLCLDPDVLQLAIRNRGDIRNDRDDNSTRSFRKAAYRNYILDRYGYLGKGNRKVCPSCVVTTIRRHYPSQTGVYMGFRHE